MVSAAGGVVLSAANRELLARSGMVVWLRADPAVLARRVGDGAGRPLLGDDPAGGPGRARRGAPAALRVGGGAWSSTSTASPPTRWSSGSWSATGLGDAGPGGESVIVVPVELGERGYEVVVGAGARHQLAELVARAVPGAARAAVVTQAGIGVEVDPGLPSERFTVPDGEEAKSLAVVEELCRGFARAGHQPVRRGRGRGRRGGHRPGRIRRRRPSTGGRPT